MHSIQTTSELLSGRGKQMPVPIHSDLDRRVSELSLHRLGMRPLGDEQRGTGMAEFVRPNVKTRCREHGLPHPPAEVASAQGLAAWGGEDECILGDFDASRQMLRQLIPEESRYHHRSALICLCGTE